MSNLRTQSPATIMNDQDQFSSPDPLASSPHTAASKSGSRKGTTSTWSPNRKTCRTSIENISILPPSSPSKTVTEQTLSPWRIRVTLEAEPEDYETDVIRTTTITKKIPLKHGTSPKKSKSEASKKPQSRPRAGSNSSRRQRSATPTAERRQRQSVTDLDIIVLGDDADEDEWGKRARKNSPKKNGTKKNTKTRVAEAVEPTDPLLFEVRHDTDTDGIDDIPIQSDSPELRQIDLNKVAVRKRSNSTKFNISSSKEGVYRTQEQHPLKQLPVPTGKGRRTVSANSAMTYPTPSPTASERGRSVETDYFDDDAAEHAEGLDTIMESEGFTMIDLDSIPSVKHILSSPLESQHSDPASESTASVSREGTVQRHSPVFETTPNARAVHVTHVVPPHIVLPDDESDISSTLPSSPPKFEVQQHAFRQSSPLNHLQVPVQPRNRIVTPQILSSPELPSPPRQTVIRDRSTPDSVKAVRAGLALQGAIQPTQLPMKLPVQRQTMTKEVTVPRTSSDALFEGFDSGTKRELRAGLRFGEELVKRQHANLASRNVTSQQIDAMPQVWRGESVISRTPVQAQLEQEQGKMSAVVSSSKHDLTKARDQSDQRLELRRDLSTDSDSKHLNHLERTKIFQRPRTEDHSNVIVVGSDEEVDEDEADAVEEGEDAEDLDLADDEGDIWLEEAKDSSSSPRQEQEDSGMSSQPKQRHWFEIPKSADEKPRRSVIPSPWKRGEIVEPENNSTIITNGDDMSGILWKQQNDDVQFGAAAIDGVRKELRKSGGSDLLSRRQSGVFDINQMLGTPKRIRDTLAQEQVLARTCASRTQGFGGTLSETSNQSSASKEDYDDAESHESLYSDEADLTLQQVEKIPVNFNDSTISHSQVTPQQQRRTRTSTSPSAQRPPTPRSAMKGSRQSFGPILDRPEVGDKRVVFAQRSKGVSLDWVENSSTLHSSTEEVVSSPLVEHQRHHEARQLVLASQSVLEDELSPAPIEEVQTVAAIPVQDPSQKGWLGWLWNSKQQDLSSDVLSLSSQVDGTHDSAKLESRSKSGMNYSSPDFTKQVQPQSSISNRQQIPSYLLAPSYPSDPLRAPTVKSPLATSGRFTNTHFRTLHILHRKSQRPRFHGPEIQTCRPEIRDLVAQRWKLELDETDAGLGGFKWTVGETEARVLERFCREVEFDVLSKGLDEKQLEDHFGTWCADGGIWSGHVGHGMADVKWGWTIEELATHLGRIVVGEVVREEEFGGKNYKP